MAIYQHLSANRSYVVIFVGLNPARGRGLFVPVADNPGRVVKHARYYWLLLAEGHLKRRLFGDMLRRIWALPVPGA